MCGIRSRHLLFTFLSYHLVFPLVRFPSGYFFSWCRTGRTQNPKVWRKLSFGQTNSLEDADSFSSTQEVFKAFTAPHAINGVVLPCRCRRQEACLAGFQTPLPNTRAILLPQRDLPLPSCNKLFSSGPFTDLNWKI